MATRGYFFDSVSGDRIYSSLDFSYVFRQLAKNGFTLGDRNELKVIENSPTGMSVLVQTGTAWAEGRMVEVYSTEQLSIASNSSGDPRIDRIIVRKDTNSSARSISVEVKQGTPAASPSPPSLQRDSTVHELSLAQIYVASGASAITNSDITDERWDETVCGLSIHPALSRTDGEWVLLDTHQDDDSGTPFDYTYTVPGNAMRFDEYRVTGYVHNDSGSQQNVAMRFNGASTDYRMTYYNNSGIGTFTTGTAAMLIAAVNAPGVVQFDLYATGRHKYGNSYPRFRVRSANGSTARNNALSGHLAQVHDQMNSLRVMLGTSGGQNGRGVLKIWGRNLWNTVFPS